MNYCLLVESMMTRSSSSANLARVATATSARFAELERQGGIFDSLSIIQRAFSLVEIMSFPWRHENSMQNVRKWRTCVAMHVIQSLDRVILLEKSRLKLPLFSK